MTSSEANLESACDADASCVAYDWDTSHGYGERPPAIQTYPRVYTHMRLTVHTLADSQFKCTTTNTVADADFKVLTPLYTHTVAAQSD